MGARISTLPLRPAIPPACRQAVHQIEHLLRDLRKLHGRYHEAIYGSILLFASLKPEKLPADPDAALDGLPDLVEQCETATRKPVESLTEKMAALDNTLPESAPVEVAVYFEAIKVEVERLWAGVDYARGWTWFVKRHLLGLAVASVLRRQWWGHQRGAQVASFAVAALALAGVPDEVPEGLPFSRFGLRHRLSPSLPDPESLEHEVRTALDAVVALQLMPAKQGRSRAGSTAMIRSAARYLGVRAEVELAPLVGQVVLEGWGHLGLIDLYRLAVTGRMAIAPERIRGRALDAAGVELREIMPAPSYIETDASDRARRFQGRRGGFEDADGYSPENHHDDAEPAGADAVSAEAAHQSGNDLLSEPAVSPVLVAEFSSVLADTKLLEFAVAAIEEGNLADVAKRLRLSIDGVNKRRAKAREVAIAAGYHLKKKRGTRQVSTP